jgi:hypothetical protein
MENIEDSKYTDRHEEIVTVDRKNPSKDGGATLHFTNGWACYAPPEVANRVHVGSVIVQETRNLSLITGWRDASGWILHKSDAGLAREHEEMVEGFKRERRERLAKHRDEWQARTDALPDWLRDRIATFQERGGADFETDGWGYELVVAELAALYTPTDDFADNDAVMAVAREQGTSGNQHDMAKALARAHYKGMSLAGTVSALSPLTGNSFYEPAAQ